MAAPLATAADLAARLKVDTPAAGSTQRAQWDAALADASEHLRDVIGTTITQLTSTVTLDVETDGQLRLPGSPVTAVTSVTVDGTALAADSWRLRHGVLRFAVRRGREVTVTYTHGWATVPGELVKWTCVLAAAELASAARGNLGMAGNVASVAVDDGRVTFHSGDQQASGVDLPERVADRLRATYGAGGAYVTGGNR